MAYWPILVGSFVVSLALTPVCRIFALRYKIVDRPDDWLKTHKKPIPYLGGVAILGGWLAGLLIAFFMFENADSPGYVAGDGPSMFRMKMIGVVIAGTLITLLGLVDDIRSLPPKLKLAAGVVIALVVVGFGIGTDIVGVIFDSVRLRLEASDQWLVVVYSLPVSVFIIVGSCNATNLIDGLDGLCSGVLGIISIGFLALAVHLHMHSNWNPEEVQRVVLSLALLGASFGFLPLNRNPARIFMGDAGSMLLGMNAAILLLMFADEQRIRWMVGSMMVFGLPVTDMVLTLVRRWRAQRPLMAGDRSHFYDQLIDRGMSVRRVVRISYLLAGGFALLGMMAIQVRTRHLFLLYGVAYGVLLYAVHRFGMVRVDDPPAPSPKESAE